MMNKFTHNKFGLKSLWIALLCCLPLAMNAQPLLTDNFEYADGNLVGQGSWGQFGTTITFPLQVVDFPLSYAGYQDPAIGKAVKLDNSGQDAGKEFAEQTTGSVYASALINFTAVQSTNAQGEYFFHFGEGLTSSLYQGRVMAKKSTDGTKMQLGISRGGTSSVTVWDATEYELDKTHLIVLKYQFVEGAKNDLTSLFVNPTDFTAEPTVPSAVSATETSADLTSIKAIGIRQGTSTRTPLGHIGALRVATSWVDLMGSEPVAPKPSLTISPKSISYAEVYAGNVYTKTINIKGSNLKGDVTVSGLTSGELSVASTTIAQADIESATGYDLVVTLTPTTEDQYTDKILLDSQDLTQASVTAMWSTIVPVAATDIADLRAKFESDNNSSLTYKLAGDVVVSHVYKDGTKTYVYVQDANTGVTIYDAFGDLKTTYKTGDKLNTVLGTVEKSFGTFLLLPKGDFGAAASEGNEVVPVVATLSQLASNGVVYESRLVKVENVSFYDKANENAGIFTEGTNNKIQQDADQATMRVFKASEFLGDAIPDVATLIGVSTASTGKLIAPRSKADIVLPPVVPVLTVTPVILPKANGNINQPTIMGTLKVVSAHLPNAVSLSITGKNAASFSTSVTTIATSSTATETDVTVTYLPTTVGDHTAVLTIESLGSEILTQTISLKGFAIDPANPPTVSVKPSQNLNFAEVEIGKESMQELLVTSINLPDYLYAKVMGEGQASFTISTSMFPAKNATDASLKITFKPKAEGTFNERVALYTKGADTLFVSLTGKGIPAGQASVEGDNYPLDVINPLVIMTEKFDAITHNKPFAITGWKNIAAQNVRAWWGYDFKDESLNVIEKAAKVTAFNSVVTAAAPYEMWLYTPALDFKNVASKMFTFRVMGDLLLPLGESDAKLELYYADMAEGSLYTSKIEIDAMPKIDEDNKDWRDFHVDLTGQELADVFFMAFRFSATGGLANSAVYYIDDVTYGRTDLPLITSDVANIQMSNTDVTVEIVSDNINITGSNLTDAITLSIVDYSVKRLLSQPYLSAQEEEVAFSLTTTSLPATGGVVAVKFAPKLHGQYEAKVKLSSKGAADLYIPIVALGPVGIEDTEASNTTLTVVDAQLVVNTDAQLGVDVYNLAGVLVAQFDVQSGKTTLPYTFAQGAYLVALKSDKKAEYKKVLVP